MRRKSKPTPKPTVINENSNNAQTEISQVPVYLAANDTIMPMVTSLSYCSMHPEVQYFTNQYNVQSNYKLLKDEALSEQSDSTVTSD